MSTKIHDERHVFLKIRWPIKSETRRPLLPKFNTPDVIEKPNEMMTDKKVPLMDATPQPPIEIKPMKPLRSNSKLTGLQEKLQAEHEARAMRMKAVEREVKSAIQQLNVGDKDVPVQSKDTCTQTNLTKVDDKETITQLPVLSQHSSTLRQLSPTLSQRSSNLSQHSLILSQHVPEQKDEEQEESESVQGASEQVPVISAQFLADLNVPDGTVVVPKKNFIKVSRVDNKKHDRKAYCMIIRCGKLKTMARSTGQLVHAYYLTAVVFLNLILCLTQMVISYLHLLPVKKPVLRPNFNHPMPLEHTPVFFAL